MVQGACCLVAWSKITRPSELDNLGVVDLTTLGYALRLRWKWITCIDPKYLWVPLPSQAERIIHAMFRVWVTVEVGDVTKTLFWSDRWLKGMAIESLAPNVVTSIAKRTWKTRHITEAMHGDT
jgi:hypothetical protein